MSWFLYQTRAAHRDGTRNRPAWSTAKTTSSSHYGLLNSTGYILVWGFWHKSTGKRPSSRKRLAPLNGKPKLSLAEIPFLPPTPQVCSQNKKDPTEEAATTRRPCWQQRLLRAPRLLQGWSRWLAGKGYQKRWGPLETGLDAAELFTFSFLRFSAARCGLPAHSNFSARDGSSLLCLTEFCQTLKNRKVRNGQKVKHTSLCHKPAFQMLQTYLIPWTLLDFCLMMKTIPWNLYPLFFPKKNKR